MVKNPPAMWENWVQSLDWEDPLEKGMATDSSILAWRIPWTEEPGGPQSTGHKRVGTWLSMHIQTLSGQGTEMPHATWGNQKRKRKQTPGSCHLALYNLVSRGEGGRMNQHRWKCGGRTTWYRVGPGDLVELWWWNQILNEELSFARTWPFSEGSISCPPLLTHTPFLWTFKTLQQTSVTL